MCTDTIVDGKQRNTKEREKQHLAVPVSLTGRTDDEHPDHELQQGQHHIEHGQAVIHTAKTQQFTTDSRAPKYDVDSDDKAQVFLSACLQNAVDDEIAENRHGIDRQQQEVPPGRRIVRKQELRIAGPGQPEDKAGKNIMI